MKSNYTMLCDFYELTMANGYFLSGKQDEIAYFDVFFRDIPDGGGFALARMRGSEANDEPYFDTDGTVRTKTNNCGGILGGITNGMPVIFQVAIKPTPSIAQPQQTVNLQAGKVTTIEIKGRHDPCIVPRAVPVVEAAAAIAIYDLILGNTQTNRRK